MTVSQQITWLGTKISAISPVQKTKTLTPSPLSITFHPYDLYASMESDPNPIDSLKQKASALQALVSGPIASSTATLAVRSRGIPYEKDFHFYNNFDDFKSPAREIALKSESTLQSIVASGDLWGHRKPPPLPSDLDEAFDWLVNLNDEFLERFGVSMDEFKVSREKAEEGGFQLVCGKKKRGFARNYERDEGTPMQSTEVGVKVVSRDSKTTAPRSKVPFHIPTIPRPQDEFRIVVNNSDQPFEHVGLERSEDGSRFVHPLENLSLLDFVDRDIGEGEPVKPVSLVDTPFKFVEVVRELKELAAKLQDVKEFAVDLEHNQYRSFQGLTCLMQISTRTEDFIVDTLKLRAYIGPFLREVFKDPAKRKVMHGADRDILWLQKDFGIYVCNLFDTGQASRVMQLERNSLEYLLHNFCGVNANKEYQNADWRLRPLPEEMLKYAREDTHYLLHIYDLMKIRLLSTSSSENDLLFEVYRRSYEVCMQFYEKDRLTDTTYLHIYGLQEAGFSSKQLAIVSGLCEWRDKVAREEDESTGYILPNKTLLEIAKQMPLSAGKLHWLVKSKHPYVERNLSSVIHIIKCSIENCSSFESISEELKKAYHEVSSSQNIEGANNLKLLPTEDPLECKDVPKDVFVGSSNAAAMHNAENATSSMISVDEDVKPTTAETSSSRIAIVSKSQQQGKLKVIPLSESRYSYESSDATVSLAQEKIETMLPESVGSAKKTSIASVQLSKKPTSTFGALLGSTSSRRRINPDNGVSPLMEKNATIIHQIKSSVALPFHTFSGEKNHSEPSSSEASAVAHPYPDPPKQSPEQMAEISTVLDEVIPLENISDGSDSPSKVPLTEENSEAGSPTSLSDLSSSFNKCFQSINERRGLSKQEQRPHQEEETTNIQVMPFDYVTAQQGMRLGEPRKEGETAASNSREKRKDGLASGREQRESGFKPPRRRQAFPPTGNRSVTYR